MSRLLSSPTVFLGIGAVLILVASQDILAAALRFSHRLLKFDLPKGNGVRLTAILQVAAGLLVTVILRFIHNDPVLDLVIGAAFMLLSGLPLIKAFLVYPWKICLMVWAVAFVVQLVAVPLATGAILAVFIVAAALIFPPQV
jgi:hypothetical protein